MLLRDQTILEEEGAIDAVVMVTPPVTACNVLD